MQVYSIQNATIPQLHIIEIRRNHLPKLHTVFTEHTKMNIVKIAYLVRIRK